MQDRVLLLKAGNVMCICIHFCAFFRFVPEQKDISLCCIILLYSAFTPQRRVCVFLSIRPYMHVYVCVHGFTHEQSPREYYRSVLVLVRGSEVSQSAAHVPALRSNPLTQHPPRLPDCTCRSH